MTEQDSSNIGFPETAADALKQWDAGKEVPAIGLYADRSSQAQIYAFAFELIRAGLNDEDLSNVSANAFIQGKALEGITNLTKRETEAAYSLAVVALKKGWAAMLRQHDHDSIAKFNVRKLVAKKA